MKKIFIFSKLLFFTLITYTLHSFNTLEIVNKFIEFPNLEYIVKRSFKKTKKKPWTIIIYMAADNNLSPFALKNIIQLAKIGSTPFVNILVHLDIILPGNKKITLRYYIKKGKLILTNHQNPETQKMDSGNPETLISACKWAIENFPADNIMLDLWNHGIGTLDIRRSYAINLSELFIFNSSSNKLDLDRSVPFLEFITLMSHTTDQRGICFDDSTGNYLTNNDLVYALDTIKKNVLKNKKMSIICFDACLMQMLEIANLMKSYANFMVGSEEVVLGSGYNYEKIISIFTKHSPDPKTLAKYIVEEYEKTYAKITNDYTQSAIDLNKVTELETVINCIADLLIEALKYQQNQSVKKAIKTSRHKLLCTHFDIPSYIDLHHFLSNLINNLNRFNCYNSQKEKKIKLALKEAIKHALKLIDSVVFANTVGKNLKQAKGISIYFPELKIHASYRKTPFASQNKWVHFLSQYILS